MVSCKWFADSVAIFMKHMMQMFSTEEVYCNLAITEASCRKQFVELGCGNFTSVGEYRSRASQKGQLSRDAR